MERLQKSSSKPPKLMRLCQELQQEIHSWGQLALPFTKAKRPTPRLKEDSRKVLRDQGKKVDVGANLEEIPSGMITHHLRDFRSFSTSWVLMNLISIERKIAKPTTTFMIFSTHFLKLKWYIFDCFCYSFEHDVVRPVSSEQYKVDIAAERDARQRATYCYNCDGNGHWSSKYL